jgi:energy-coupling factor transport system ATP-binding protein
MVFQNPETQLFNRSVLHEIAFGLESLGLPKDTIRKRIEETAELVKISNLLMRNPHELSGGEQQLVSIAAILALNPQLMVLDEPYANLDPLNVCRVREALQSVHRRGTGVVICEHRMPCTLSDVQRIAVLHRGKVVLDGPPNELLNHELQSYGLELPLSTRVGQRLGLTPVPLDIGSVDAFVSKSDLPVDLKPAFPAPISNHAPPVLEVEHVSFALNGRQILRDISFSLHEGESLAIVGANGAGKTVLIKHLNGLNHPNQGRVLVMDRDTRHFKVSELAKYVGISFQNPNSQFFKLNVWDEISVGPEAVNRFDESWIENLIGLFHLEPLKDRAPFRLSGGEKKRVAFAAALATKPVILVLDEPTAGQDWYFRRALGDLLTKLRALGQAVILVTHDLSFAEQHAHRWLLLADGQVVSGGKPWEVMANAEAMKRAHLEPTEAFRLYGADGTMRDPATGIHLC